MNSKENIYNKLSNYWKEKENGEFLNISKPQASSDNQGDVILSTSDANEYAKKKLELQQNHFLGKQWRKGGRQIVYKNLQSENLRLPSYIDYELMTQHEIIGRALEIYVEETMVPDRKGNILSVHSENKQVQKELNKLLFNNLNLHVNLPSITHEMLKNGDGFLHLHMDSEKGVKTLRIIPTSQVERIEPSHLNFLSSLGSQYDDGLAKFRWRSAEDTVLNYWSVAHFRLMLDQTRLPYGTSILEKCRRVWKNLILAEDAMLSAQLMRGIDRLVHKVEVGNLDPEDVDAYIEELANRFKRKIRIDPQTGNIDHQFNVASIDQDFFIAVRNGVGSEITKLEGQSSMNNNVVEHLMKKLVAALGIPMAYLSYEQVSGEGKSLAMQDARFAKTIMRIQQALIQELNKIATIHLILIGMEDEIDNFMISMNNPSIQNQILHTELMAQQVDLFNALTDASASGIPPWSYTKAKREIFGLNNDEILEDLKRIRIETAAKMELDKTDEVIPKSGLFNDVDAIYGTQIDASVQSSETEGEEEDFSVGGGSGPSLSGGSLEGGEEDIETELSDEDVDSSAEDQIDLTDDDLEESIFRSLSNIEVILKG